MMKPIEIVGGGIAGLVLGIGLRQRGVPVIVWEAGRYPRHRVCGEFLSGRGQDTLERLGLLPLLVDAGARFATEALFASRVQETPIRKLPRPALCLSRYALDACLANELVRLGGDLHSETRWKGKFAEGIAAANGRRTEIKSRGLRYLALKAHIHEVSLKADLEMHLVPSGYVGLCRLQDHTVNVCGLFRVHGGDSTLAANWRSWLWGSEGSILHSRLSTGHFVENSFCATAGFSLEYKWPEANREIRIGDALAMIPPIVGNGISMACESAEIAINPLAEYSQGINPWDEVQRQISNTLALRFRNRVRWASRLHRHLFILPNAILPNLLRFDWVWGHFFNLTR